jgi:hypothetical protein
MTLLGSAIERMSIRIGGEVLRDLLGLARVALDEDQKDVAAVLAAAAFEDTMRRMGRELAYIQDRPKLSDVLQTLQAKHVLDGPQFSTAQSYLTFCNRALHAEWDRIDGPTTVGAVAFVEQLLLEHFSR